MSRPDTRTVAAAVPPADRAAGRVAALAERLATVAGRGWAVVSGAEAPGPDASAIADDLWLVGGDGSRRAIAADVLADALRAEAEIESLCGEIVERYEEATLLYRLAERLGAVIGEGAIARLVLEQASAVLGPRRAEIWLHRDAAVELAAAVPSAPADTRIERGGPFSALYDNQPWLGDEAGDRPCEVAVPLPDPGSDPLGVMIFRGRADGRPYRSGDVKLLSAIAALASSFVRNDRLSAAARVADAKRREDEIARQVHAGLLPHHRPDFPGLDIAATCRAAETVGGDYYGYPTLADGGPAVVMADISGHGVGAALYMAAAKGAIQAEASRLVSPSDLLRRLNEALSADFSRSDVFATAFIARFDRDRAALDYSNGGHHPPMVIRRDGRIERLERGGLALGVMPSVLYQEESRAFSSGDVLVLYTDGLIEARDARGEFYGAGRLERCLRASRENDAAGMRDAVMADLDRFVGRAPLRDDVTLMVVRSTSEAGR